MPDDLARTINGWVNDAVKELAGEGRLAALGIEPATQTPEALARFIVADRNRSAALLEAVGFHRE
jgi:hypothetical protein